MPARHRLLGLLGAAALMASGFLSAANAQTKIIASDREVSPQSSVQPGFGAVFASPVVEPPPGGTRWVLIRPGTILASTLIWIEPAKAIADADIALPDEIGATLPSRLLLVRTRRGGAEWLCTPRGLEAKEGATGRTVRVCLTDADGDGRLDRGLAVGRRFEIAPVAVRPLKPAAGERYPAMRFHRFLRVERLDETAAVVAPIVTVTLGGGFGKPHASVGEARPPEQLSLRLAVDSLLSFAGLAVRVRRGPGGWWALVTGDYDPPLRLEQEGTVVAVGGVIVWAVGEEEPAEASPAPGAGTRP